MMPVAESFAVVELDRENKRGAREVIESGDLLYWLSAIHVAQLEAGEAYDHEGWGFMLDWYLALSM